MQNAVCTMHLILLVVLVVAAAGLLHGSGSGGGGVVVSAAPVTAAATTNRRQTHPKYHFHEIIAPSEKRPHQQQGDESVSGGSNPINPENGFRYNSYSKHHSGRHVCTAQKNITQPIKTKESYCRPVYKKYVRRCNNNQLCTGVRLVCETAYREILTTASTTQITYVCCPGWYQFHNRSHGCNKSHCSAKCQNGGSCVKPNWCSCPKGFTGRYCEHDINECKEQKPCDQICHNTFGSYKCECRESFILQSDGQSCRKADGNGPAFEAKDLECADLDRRLHKLEMILTNERNISTLISSNEMQKITQGIEKLSKDVTLLKHKFKEMEKYKTELLHSKNDIK